jgi:hypothetical protein
MVRDYTGIWRLTGGAGHHFVITSVLDGNPQVVIIQKMFRRKYGALAR